MSGKKYWIRSLWLGLLAVPAFLVFYYWNAIWSFLSTHATIVSPLVGGVLGSLVASVIMYWWLERPSKRDREVYLKKLTDTVSSLEAGYRYLVQQLPQAIGGPFTKSLFGYYHSPSQAAVDSWSTISQRSRSSSQQSAGLVAQYHRRGFPQWTARYFPFS